MAIMRNALRILLGAALLFAGTSHLTFARYQFAAQVPSWLPLDVDFVVLASGAVEIALGISLILLKKWRPQVGLITALFFIAVFPGNIAQFIDHKDAFGLNTDLSRGIRLLFQPLLVLWSLWCTRALSLFRGQ
jgi:uncharacterized membrane protein